jgi:hypothetical protein
MTMHMHNDRATSTTYTIHPCPNGCGGVCLGFGATTIHVSRADFMSILDLMSQAARRLGIGEEGAPASQAHGVQH